MYQEIIRKKLSRRQRAGKDMSKQGSQAGGSHAPPGFAPVPNSRHGGYRKRHGQSWVYWYPDSGVAGHGEADHDATKRENERLQQGGDRQRATEDAVSVGEDAVSAGKPKDEVAAAMMAAVDTSNPTIVAQAQAELAKFNLSIVGDDIEAAKAVAMLYAANIDKDEDFCKVAPPACAGNMGIPRHDMPQIIGDSLADLLKVKDGVAKDKWKYDEIVKAGGDVSDVNATIQDLFLQSLEADGIKIDRSGKPMKVGELKATQSQIQANKAAKFAAWILADKFPGGAECTLAKSPIVITSDGYILDGHHRYAAVRLTGTTKTIPTVQVDMPMKDLLERSLEFPGVFRAGLDDKPISNEADAKAAGAQWPKPDFSAYAAAAAKNLAEYKKSLPILAQLEAFAKGGEPDAQEDAPVSEQNPSFPKLPSSRELDDMIDADDKRLEAEKAARNVGDDKPEDDKPEDDKPEDDKPEDGDVEKGGFDALRARLALRKGCADKPRARTRCRP